MPTPFASLVDVAARRWSLGEVRRPSVRTLACGAVASAAGVLTRARTGCLAELFCCPCFCVVLGRVFFQLEARGKATGSQARAYRQRL